MCTVVRIIQTCAINENVLYIHDRWRMKLFSVNLSITLNTFWSFSSVNQQLNEEWNLLPNSVRHCRLRQYRLGQMMKLPKCLTVRMTCIHFCCGSSSSCFRSNFSLWPLFILNITFKKMSSSSHSPNGSLRGSVTHW